MNKKFLTGLSIVSLLLMVSPVSATDLTVGKVIYDKMCAKCHGDTGKGDGIWAKKMRLKMKDFSNKEEMAKVSDEELFEVIKKGGKILGKSPRMPAYGKRLSDKEINDIVAYIRLFSE